MLSFRYGDTWSEWHGERSGETEDIDLTTGSLINRISSENGYTMAYDCCICNTQIKAEMPFHGFLGSLQLSQYWAQLP